MERKSSDIVVTCDKRKMDKIFRNLLSKAGFNAARYGLVLIKSNVCGMYHPDIKIIEQLLEFFAPLAKRIVIGETDSMIRTPVTQFKGLGITDLVEHFDEVEAMNLIEDEILHLNVPSPHAVSQLPIPKLVRESDLLVNVAKTGTHSNTKLTCALKNLFGLLAEKRKYSVYHPVGVDRVIADLMKIVRCDLNVVESRDQIIVGLDPLMVDICACGFLDIDPLRVEHLKLVSEDRNEKLGDVITRLKILTM